MASKVTPTNVETVLPDGVFIYSRTDLKSYIVEANQAFADICGYKQEEMVGQPHNLVRHPDMPKEAFADLWHSLKAGRPWRGVIKNLRKDGGYYWVVANASPVRENGQIVGYQSVRTRPTRDEIEAATDAYRRIKQGDSRLAIENGRVIVKRAAWRNWLGALHVQLSCAALLPMLTAAIVALAQWRHADWATAINTLLVLNLLFGAYLLFSFVPRLKRDLGQVRGYLDDVLESGNLKSGFDLSRRDVVGTIGRQVGTFVSSVQATVQGIGDAVSQVHVATGEVNCGVSEIHQAAQIQNEATASTAAAVEQISVSVQEVASNAGTTSDSVSQTGQAAVEGATLSERASREIERLAETVKASSEEVEALGRSSAEVGAIAAAIKEIAEQTNLLALNAAIEAARAGESGRGFAVVADEVRKLAERTGKATQEIDKLIVAIQRDSERAVSGMRAGAGQVGHAVTLVRDAQGALQRINEQMEHAISRVAHISLSSAEQSSAMNVMAQNVERVAAMTERNVVSVQQTQQMAAVLDQMVLRMRKAVTQYEV